MSRSPYNRFPPSGRRGPSRSDGRQRNYSERLGGPSQSRRGYGPPSGPGGPSNPSQGGSGINLNTGTIAILAGVLILGVGISLSFKTSIILFYLFQILHNPIKSKFIAHATKTTHYSDSTICQ